VCSSDLLVVTEAFVSGALFGALTALTAFLGAAFGATLVALTALTGFLGAALAAALVLVTTLAGDLFAALLADLVATACLGLVAVFVDTALVAALGAAFVAALVATFAATFTGFTVLRAGAVLAAFALLGEVFTVFLVAFAMGPSNKWVCQCCKGNWRVSQG
jgi:hypothetical protein